MENEKTVGKQDEKLQLTLGLEFSLNRLLPKESGVAICQDRKQMVAHDSGQR